jgi:putative membrane protein
MRAMHVAAVALSSVLTAGTIAGAVTDQTTGKETTEKSMAPPEAAPTAFLKKAASAGIAEVELGKLAEQRGSSPAVKAYGKMMVTDHTAANAELKTLAAKKGYELPTKLDAKEAATREELSTMSGAKFDQAYMATMTSDHDKVVEDFEQASKSSTDDDVKRFAAKTLPVLEGHLAKAKEIQANLGQASAR